MEKLLPNAKLNLMLKIIDKLPNGYHLLEMINVPINLFDEMAIEIDAQFKQSFDPPIDCPPDKTTIYKAYQLLKDLVGDINVNVRIKKNIPSGAGMGGGSSDAGFFIRYILDKKNIKPDEQLLKEIANKVGADVPFFLYNRPSIVKGIGERVLPFKKFPILHFVVIVPDFSISTAWAYGKVKLPLTKSQLNSILDNSEINKEQLINIMENDLEYIVEKDFSIIRKIKEFLLDLGAKKAMMTGSGSAVFGIFDDADTNKWATKEAKKYYNKYRIYSCKTLGA